MYISSHIETKDKISAWLAVFITTTRIASETEMGEKLGGRERGVDEKAK